MAYTEEAGRVRPTKRRHSAAGAGALPGCNVRRRRCVRAPSALGESKYLERDLVSFHYHCLIITIN